MKRSGIITMLVINQSEVTEVLSMESCISVMETAFVDLARGEATQNLRSAIPLKKGNLMGFMPGNLEKQGVFGAKVITVFPDNHHLHNLPSHQGVVLLFDSETGVIKASVDGTKITAIRTAAVSGVATKILAKQQAETLCILGTGEQARTHLEAMLLVRPIKRVNVWSRSLENANLFKREMENKFNVSIEAFEKVEDAVFEADIICTLTGAKNPILKGEWIKKGVHINAVGACSSSTRELDSELVKKSLLYVDRIESAINESGDYLIPLKEGVIKEGHIMGELGDLLIKKIDGRDSEDAITIFDSLGLAIEDIAAANFIFNEILKRK